MATAAATASAAGKLSRMRRTVWVDGPVCSEAELKTWEIELPDLLLLVAEVERAAGSTPKAVQWLRRMFYSRPLGRAGAGFDKFIATDPARLGAPMTTVDVRQSVLDALVRVDKVRVPGATTPLDLVEVSHIFVLLDLVTNGASPAGDNFDTVAATTGDTRLESILSWTGDLGSAWLGYQKPMLVAKAAAAPGTWTEPVTPAGLATPLGWLEDGIRGRSPADDLLGDLDAVVLAHQPLPASPTPIATLLADYYTPGAHSTATTARVAERFSLFVTRATPAIPHNPAGTALLPTARDAIRTIIEDSAFWLLMLARTGGSKAKYFLERGGAWADLRTPWSAKMIDELADRFTAFLTAGLAGTAPTWLTQPSSPLPYPGYEWLPTPSPLLTPTPGADDLEAVAQFHLNWRTPHEDLRTADRVLRPLNLRDPAGTAATLLPGTPAVIQVEAFVDLRDVQPAAAGAGEHADLLRLTADTARPGGAYRIVAVDPAARTVTVEGTPALPGPSAWRVVRRPRLLLVDPFGGRDGGAAASTLGMPAGWVEVDGLPDLDRTLANFDTVLLDADLFRPSRTYRIRSVHPTLPRLELDGSPLLAGSSGWRVPAGVAAAVYPQAATFTPTPAGCDHYDGLLFVLYDNAVQGDPVPATSYSSVVYAADPVLASSVTGNARYAVRSLRSPAGDPDSPDRNYEFAVTDPDKVATDLVAGAGYYADAVTAQRRAPGPGTARRDTDGKTHIRLHIGNSGGAGAGTQGDLVSPAYYALRARLVALHQAERALLGLPADPALAAVAAATTHAASVALYAGATVPAAGWDDRLRCHLVLVRPDLRPTV